MDPGELFLTLSWLSRMALALMLEWLKPPPLRSRRKNDNCADWWWLFGAGEIINYHKQKSFLCSVGIHATPQRTIFCRSWHPGGEPCAQQHTLIPSNFLGLWPRRHWDKSWWRQVGVEWEEGGETWEFIISEADQPEFWSPKGHWRLKALNGGEPLLCKGSKLTFPPRLTTEIHTYIVHTC